MVDVHALFIAGAGLVPVYDIIVPNGVQSVNGSDVSMGCPDIPMCNAMTGTGFLTDNIVPTFDLNIPNWASQLVTIKKVDPEVTPNIHVEHVQLTFQFADTHAITTITAIFIDLLLCPKWGIGAPVIFVFSSNNLEFEFDSTHGANAEYLLQYQPTQKTCNCSMSTIIMPVESGEEVLPVWHIFITASQVSDFEWVHVAEIRFSNVPVTTTQSGTYCIYQPIPGNLYSNTISQ